MTIAIIIGLLFVLFFLRVPIAFSILAVSLLYVFALSTLPPTVGIQRMISGVDSFVLLALPLFVLAGNLMNTGGMTRRMVNAALAYVGHVRGGLAQTNIGASVLMSGVSGSAVVDASALGSMMIPAMRRAGYSREYSSALTASSAVIGPLVPPSIPMVVIATAASLGVGDMFLAGAVPGLLVAAGLAVATFFLSRRYAWPVEPRTRFPELVRRTVVAAPALLAPAIIVVGIVGGIFTPTEAGAAVCVYALLIGALLYRQFGRNIWSVFIESASASVSVLFIIAAAAAFGYVLTVEQVPLHLVELREPLYATPWLFLLLINIVLLVLGAFMEGLAVIILLTPVLMPAVLAAGIDPIHFGTIVVFNLMIGTITPPLGVVMYITNRIANVSVGQFIKANAPYFMVLGIMLALVTYVPAVSTWLPGLF